MFDVDKEYKLYTNFKAKVILKAQEELKQKTDIYFEFEEIKTGRAVTEIKFLIFSQKQPKQTDQEEPEPKKIKNQIIPPVEKKQPEKVQEKLNNESISILLDLGFNQKDAETIAARETAEFIKENAIILKQMQQDNRIKTSIPAFSKGFTTDFRKQKTAFELEQEEQQRQAQINEEQRKIIKIREEKGKEIYNKMLAKYRDNFFNDNQNSEHFKEFDNFMKGKGKMYKNLRIDIGRSAFIQLLNQRKVIDLDSAVVLTAAEEGIRLLKNEFGNWITLEKIVIS